MKPLKRVQIIIIMTLHIDAREASQKGSEISLIGVKYSNAPSFGEWNWSGDSVMVFDRGYRDERVHTGIEKN
jgi:hypothetical protein